MQFGIPYLAPQGCQIRIEYFCEFEVRKIFNHRLADEIAEQALFQTRNNPTSGFDNTISQAYLYQILLVCHAFLLNVLVSVKFTKLVPSLEPFKNIYSFIRETNASDLTVVTMFGLFQKVKLFIFDRKSIIYVLCFCRGSILLM